MTKVDLLTGEEFYAKRINQNFASAQNRIRYHNKRATELRRRTSYINKPLHLNIKILNDLMEGNSTKTFHKQFLLGKGFNFSIHTHVEEYKGNRYYAIYNFLIGHQENEKINIIKYA